jgi:hypothetical protein
MERAKQYCFGEILGQKRKSSAGESFGEFYLE